MNKSFLALALALSALPAAALAQDTNAPAAPTPEQRQAMRQTFQQFAQQEQQLRQQLRSQILSALSPVHQRAVAATIGELAIAPNPDAEAAAKRLDAMLSPGERQRIITAHDSFRSQSMQLHEQIRAQMQSMMPDHQAGTPDHPAMTVEIKGGMQPLQRDAGTILLTALSPRPMMEMMHAGMMHMEGAPPQ